MEKQKSKQLDNYPFNGWDWRELTECWGVYTPDNFTDPDLKGIYDDHPYCGEGDPTIWLIKGAINTHFRRYNRKSFVLRKLAKDVRIFLTKLGNPDSSFSYYGPMWLGMAQIEDDYSLMQIVMHNLTSMWD